MQGLGIGISEDDLESTIGKQLLTNSQRIY